MDGYVTRKQHLRGKDIEKKKQKSQRKVLCSIRKRKFCKKKKNNERISY